MKITLLLIGACLLPVLTGCHKPQSKEIIGAAEAAIRTTALASITAKYPDVGSSELKFRDIMIRPTPIGQDMVYVTYTIPASATTNTQGSRVTVTTQTIGVEMSLSRKVRNVSKSSSREMFLTNWH
jgi:hypothetical protein